MLIDGTELLLDVCNAGYICTCVIVNIEILGCSCRHEMIKGSFLENFTSYLANVLRGTKYSSQEENLHHFMSLFFE